ncbi:MAG: F0F1 ATP synthase subunit delta [Treponema sp.]|jgi:hypothetical protein|nr:F0F1 ATP synthase subunit delta [Treponema sp.]
MGKRFFRSARSFAGALLRAADAGHAAGAAVSPAAVAKAEDALGALKALAPCLENIPGRMGGRDDAARFERMIRRAAGIMPEDGTADDTAGLERAIRLVALLVRRNLRYLVVPVIREGEQIVDAMKGTLEVRLESAGPMEGDFLDALKERLAAGTGAKQIRIVPADDPKLLGGCRLIIGSEAIDASLRGRIAKMAADLQAVLPAGGV